MANTYTQLFIHLIFVVKGRENLIPPKFKDELYKYITGIIKEKGHKLFSINGMRDHLHLLIGLEPDEALSDLIKEIKRCSSKFINGKNWIVGKFEWQSGFAAFSYSKSQISSVCRYIEMLKKFAVDYNEKYIFEEVLGDIIPTG